MLVLNSYQLRYNYELKSYCLCGRGFHSIKEDWLCPTEYSPGRPLVDLLETHLKLKQEKKKQSLQNCRFQPSPQSFQEVLA